MPRESVPSSQNRVSDIRALREERAVAEGTLEVSVLSDETIFERFVLSVHDAITIRWEALHHSDFPVSQTEMLRYAYTALKTRVSRVNNERFYIRCDDAWALPTQIAHVVGKVGQVIKELPVVKIVPVWDERHNQHLLTRDDWELVSRRLRAYEATTTGVVLAKAIEGNRAGDDGMMDLIPIRDVSGRLVELRSYHEIDPVAAMTHMVLSLEPFGLSATPVPLHPLLMPPRFFSAGALHTYLHRLAEAGAA